MIEPRFRLDSELQIGYHHIAPLDLVSFITSRAGRYRRGSVITSSSMLEFGSTKSRELIGRLQRAIVKGNRDYN